MKKHVWAVGPYRPNFYLGKMEKLLKYLLCEIDLPSYSIIETKRRTYYQHKNDHDTLFINGYLSTLDRQPTNQPWMSIRDSQGEDGRIHLSTRRKFTANIGFSQSMTERDLWGLILWFSTRGNGFRFEKWLSYLKKNSVYSLKYFPIPHKKLDHIFASPDYAIPKYFWPMLKRVAGYRGINCFIDGDFSEADFLFEVKKCCEGSRLQALATAAYSLILLGESIDFSKKIITEVLDNSGIFPHKNLFCSLLFNQNSSNRDIAQFLESLENSKVENWWDVVVALLILKFYQK